MSISSYVFTSISMILISTLWLKNKYLDRIYSQQINEAFKSSLQVQKKVQDSANFVSIPSIIMSHHWSRIDGGITLRECANDEPKETN